METSNFPIFKLFRIPEDGQSINPVILNYIHHCQNPYLKLRVNWDLDTGNDTLACGKCAVCIRNTKEYNSFVFMTPKMTLMPMVKHV
jgi:hypothetical protein